MGLSLHEAYPLKPLSFNSMYDEKPPSFGPTLAAMVFFLITFFYHLLSPSFIISLINCIMEFHSSCDFSILAIMLSGFTSPTFLSKPSLSADHFAHSNMACSGESCNFKLQVKQFFFVFDFSYFCQVPLKCLVPC